MVEGLFSSTNYQLAKVHLEAATVRHDALARNMANVNTPGYRRVDIAPTFMTELKSVMSGGGAAGGPQRVSIDVEADAKATAVRPDGNNVSLDKELIEVNRNALQYRMMIQRINGQLKQLKTAISGRIE